MAKKKNINGDTKFGETEFFFDDCPICQAMKKAGDENRSLGYSELRQAFLKAKEDGTVVGGNLPDDPNLSLGDFQHFIGGRNDPCPCGSGKKYKRCHGQNR